MSPFPIRAAVYPCGHTRVTLPEPASINGQPASSARRVPDVKAAIESSPGCQPDVGMLTGLPWLPVGAGASPELPPPATTYRNQYESDSDQTAPHRGHPLTAVAGSGTDITSITILEAARGGWPGRPRDQDPVTPSIRSRRRSAWPLCRAYSSIMCKMPHRRDIGPNRLQRPNCRKLASRRERASGRGGGVARRPGSRLSGARGAASRGRRSRQAPC
jgi:hypothetical protein